MRYVKRVAVCTEAVFDKDKCGSEILGNDVKWDLQKAWYALEHSRKDQCGKKWIEDEQCGGKCTNYCNAEGGSHFKHKCTEQPFTEQTNTWPERTTVAVNKGVGGRMVGGWADKKETHETFRILLSGAFIFSSICLTCRWSCGGSVNSQQDGGQSGSVSGLLTMDT